LKGSVSFVSLYPCPVCKTEVSADATSCPKCGDPLRGFDTEMVFMSYGALSWWADLLLSILDPKRGYYVCVGQQPAVLIPYGDVRKITVRPGAHKLEITPVRWRRPRYHEESFWTIQVEPVGEMRFRVKSERSLGRRPCVLIDRRHIGEAEKLELLVAFCSKDAVARYLAENPSVFLNHDTCPYIS